MKITTMRTWQSDTPDYRWSVTLGDPEVDPDRLKICTDDIPTTKGAREFAAAILAACDELDGIER